MFLLDSANTTFITPTWMYCYNVMPFDHKNVEATYQHMMSRMFGPLLEKSMEAYIDDIPVKSKPCVNHLAHLHEAFQLMRLHHLRLNPTKCIFGVESKKFLGFVVSKKGIEMAPEQSRVVLQMQSLKTRKQIQALTRKLVALNMFISRYSNRLRLFFKALKGASSGDWGLDYDKAF